MGTSMAIMIDIARKVRLWAPSYAAPTGKRRECVGGGKEGTRRYGQWRRTAGYSYTSLLKRGVTLLETPVEAYASPITIGYKRAINEPMEWKWNEREVAQTTHLIIFADNIWDHNHDWNPCNRHSALEDECTNGILNEIEGVVNPSTYCWTSLTECAGWFWDPVTMILTLSQRLTNIHGHVVSSNIQHWMHFLSVSNRFWHLKKWFNDYILISLSWHIVDRATIWWPLTVTGCNRARVQADVGEGVRELRMVVEAEVGAWIGWDGLPVGHQYHSNHRAENPKNGNNTAVQSESLQQWSVAGVENTKQKWTEPTVRQVNGTLITCYKQEIFNHTNVSTHIEKAATIVVGSNSKKK